MTVFGSGFLIENQHGIVIRQGHDLPIKELECCLIVSVDPPVIVFSSAVLLDVNRVERFIQVDIKGGCSLLADGNSSQDVSGRAVSRIGNVDHVEGRFSSLEHNDSAAARLEFLRPALLFVTDLQKE